MTIERGQIRLALWAGGMQLGAAAGLWVLASRWTDSAPVDFAIQGAVSLLVSGLVALLAALHGRLAAGAEDEEAEQAAATGGESIFGNEVDVAGRRQRALRQFRRGVLPLLLVVLSGAEAGAAVAVWRLAAGRSYPVLPADLSGVLPLVSLALAAGVAGFLFGKYCAGLAFGAGRLFLRPVCGRLLYGAAVGAAVGLAGLGLVWGHRGPGLLVGRAVAIAGMVLAAERLVTWVMDLYRPVSASGAELPVYESRILGLFSQPRGVLSNLAEMIAYQFGVTLSERWFYGVLTRVAAPFAGLQVVTLLALSCLVHVGPTQVGVVERWGSAEPETLGPGVTVRPPWPVVRVHRVDVSTVRTVRVAAATVEDAEGQVREPEAVLWRNEAFGRALFVTRGSAGGDQAGQGVSMSLAAVGVSVRFRVRDARAFVLGHRDAAGLLGQLGRRELGAYLAERRFGLLFPVAVEPLGEVLAERIGAAAERHGLGIALVSVSVDYLQPPPQVAAAFREVVEAREEARRRLSEAEAYAEQVAGQAMQEANRLVTAVSAENARVRSLAKAEAENFDKQLALYRQYGALYRTRAAMDVLEIWLKDVNKIVVTSENQEEVINLDLKKARPDLLSVE